MRVALVHPFSWPEVRRGGERLLHDLGWYLSRANHRVELITGTWSSPGVTEEDGVVIRRLQLHAPRGFDERGAGPMEIFGISALRALTRHRYDVVHCLTPTGVLAASATGHRSVYTVLGHPAAEDFALRPGSAPLFRAAVGRATITTALSASAAQRVEGLAGGAGRRGLVGRRRRPAVRVLPPGVRTDRFTPDPEPRRGSPRVLFASDASEIRKGVHHALAAVGRLRREEPGARLVLCGPGDPSWARSGVGRTASAVLARTDPLAVNGLDRDGVEALEAAERLTDVRPGDMPGLYRSATVTVLPSWEEAFGLVLAESLACGTPVACFSEAGMLEVVDRPEVGRTARFGDDDDLARAIREADELARTPGGPAACAAHARRWGWEESVGPAYEALYREIAG